MVKPVALGSNCNVNLLYRVEQKLLCADRGVDWIFYGVVARLSIATDHTSRNVNRTKLISKLHASSS